MFEALAQQIQRTPWMLRGQACFQAGQALLAAAQAAVDGAQQALLEVVDALSLLLQPFAGVAQATG